MGAGGRESECVCVFDHDSSQRDNLGWVFLPLRACCSGLQAAAAAAAMLALSSQSGAAAQQLM